MQRAAFATTNFGNLTGASASADLPRQWLIAADARLVPAGWQSTQFGNFHVAWNAPLPCTRLPGNAAATSGVILGWYIGSDGVLLGEVKQPSTPGLEGFDEILASLAGNYVCLLAAGSDIRFYLDACGSLSAFYAAEQQCITSNIFLIPDTQRDRDNRRYAGRFDIPASSCMFPVGMTPRMDVERLLPNHYLDLTSWKAVRHWPKSPLAETTDVRQTVAEIGDLIARNISAVARAVPIQMSLTAGRDSRMLLACARPWVKQASYFTTAHPDRTGRLDVHVAQRLAKTFGLRHRVLPFLESSEADGAKWLYRTSVSVGERNGFREMRTLMQLDPGRAYLPGLVAELARGYYWDLVHDLPDPEDRDCLSEALLKSMRAPVDAYTLARMTAWMSGVPACSPWSLLDFFYLEQRLGCWAGVCCYAYADMIRFESWPLNSRRLTALMLSLPYEYKLGARLNDDVIRSRWPELAELPYNKGKLHFHLVDALAHPVEEAARLRLRRALANPLWAARKMRTLWAARKMRSKARRKLRPTVGY
jgi:hypothetical protein